MRKNAENIYRPDSTFKIGEAEVLRDGEDVSIIVGGVTMIGALKAAEMLAAKAASARVVDMFTIKPIGEACVIDCARKTGAIVTAENHQIRGGLGSAVAEVLAERLPTPMERVGIRDEFGEVGLQDYLKERFKITAPHIVRAALRTIERKQN